MSKVIIFGATGALGSECEREFSNHSWSTYAAGRDLSQLPTLEKIDAAVWAQGANFTGSLLQTPDQVWDELWEANVQYIVKSIRVLMNLQVLMTGSRLVLVSSVWQNIARSDKLAYIATKSAVGGLVRGLCAELGSQGISVNGVLPGIVDTLMTRQNLSKQQIDKIEVDTPGRELVTPTQVARVIRFLASSDSAGINGQSITVDSGWTTTRYV